MSTAAVRMNWHEYSLPDGSALRVWYCPPKPMLLTLNPADKPYLTFGGEYS